MEIENFAQILAFWPNDEPFAKTKVCKNFIHFFSNEKTCSAASCRMLPIRYFSLQLGFIIVKSKNWGLVLAFVARQAPDPRIKVDNRSKNNFSIFARLLIETLIDVVFYRNNIDIRFCLRQKKQNKLNFWHFDKSRFRYEKQNANDLVETIWTSRRFFKKKLDDSFRGGNVAQTLLLAEKEN